MSLHDFRNEPFTDFSDPEHEAAMKRALAEVEAQLGRTYPLIIDGEKISTATTIASINPANPSQVVGYVASASAAQAAQAIERANVRFESWRKVPAAERADYLFKLAAEMRRRKFELCAWIIYEVSKNWAEADGDVAEAIDFCMFYGNEMLRLAGPHAVHQLPGEHAELHYVPIGAGVAIPPWNFPLAITTNLVVAPLVTGNTVVLKPSPRSPIIAAKLMEMLEAVGVPAGVVNFITGADAVIGDVLVDHPKTRFIGFTGSKEIGLRINERAAKVQPGQKWIKRVMLEMGGKDTTVVDETADLDAAAQGIAAAAFGFQGQKCSACSRAIIVESVYDSVLKKVVERTKKLTQGDPTDPKNSLGAVVDSKAFAKIKEYIEIGRSEGRLMTGGEAGDGSDGYFIPPTIIGDIAPKARLSQEEIFGPVLAFLKASDWNEALEIANNTEYGLTGAVFSRSRERLEQARDDFHVGNLYFNRKCTGALVGVQPFGGFNMSGTDSKAGGPDYLFLFTQAKSITDRF
jgi:1-pyrroline-5-carboxylate dehydrogenase